MKETKRKRLGELLLEKGLINERQLNIALSVQKITGDRLGETLVSLGFITSKTVAEVLAEQWKMEYIDLSIYPPYPEALKLIPRAVAEEYQILPIYVKNNELVLGLVDPGNFRGIDIARRLTSKLVVPKIIDKESFNETIEKTYYFIENPIDKEIKAIIESFLKDAEPDVAAVSNLLDLLIAESIRRRATDIHITPQEKVIMIFYRIDGVLQFAYSLPKKIHTTLVSRVKILSGMDIAEQRLPQDGAFTYTFLGREYDMRSSTVPTIHGENVVIRILTKSSSLLDLSRLGFWPEQVELLKELFAKPYGILLITGPTGSGKTTTLYSALREINLAERNVITVEDPVEYRFSFVRQTQVNERAGYTFALAGRNFMRQDPDVMLIGEIRDEETANIALRASITGHLVLSTLHTNDAVSSIPRLVDFNVDRFMLGYALLCVISQRLVRRICPYCKKEYFPTEKEKLEFSLPDDAILYKGGGCEACNMTGYAGRTLISEIMVVDEDIANLISEGESLLKIKKVSMEKGMIPLREDGVKKALMGITTLEEVKRVAG